MKIPLLSAASRSLQVLLSLALFTTLVSSAGATATYNASATLTFTLTSVTTGDEQPANPLDWQVEAGGSIFNSLRKVSGNADAAISHDIQPPVIMSVSGTAGNSASTSGTAVNGSAESMIQTDMFLRIENLGAQALTFNFDYSFSTNADVSVDNGAQEQALANAFVAASNLTFLVDIWNEVSANSTDNILSDTDSNSGSFSIVLGAGDIDIIDAIIDSDGSAPCIGDVLPGDINADCHTDIIDYLLLEKFAMGTGPGPSIPEFNAGDMNQNAQLDAGDLALLMRTILGIL